MTPLEARQAFKAIVNQVDSNMDTARRKAVMSDLEALRDQIPVSAKTLEVRNAINDTIADLADANIMVLIDRISERTSTLALDSAKLTAVARYADNVAKVLSLESATEFVNLAKDGLDRIEHVKVALETGDRLKIAASVEAALDFCLMLKIRAEAKIAELKDN